MSYNGEGFLTADKGALLPNYQARLPFDEEESNHPLNNKGLSEHRLSTFGGGAANFRGVQYQTNVAILATISMVTRWVRAPLTSWAIVLEPRVTAPSDPTAWDLALEPSGVLIESKLKATKEDVRLWISRCLKAYRAGNPRRFRLVYSSEASLAVQRVRHLWRLAIEATSQEHLAELVKQERLLPTQHAILAGIDDHSKIDFLRRLQFRQMPEDWLGEEVLESANRLFTTDGAQFVDLLFREFSAGAVERRTILVRDIVEETSRGGMKLVPLGQFEPTELEPAQSATVALLQVCKSGLPLEVVANSVSSSPEILLNTLEPLFEANVILKDEGLLRILPLPSTFAVPSEPQLLERGLDSLTTYLRAEIHARADIVQFTNVVLLAEKLYLDRPMKVARLFEELEHPLKDLGNKYLVYDIARLSMLAAKESASVDKKQAAAIKARALICGISWVYQRTSKLERARLSARDGLRMCENLHLSVTQAFGERCYGRLCRMEAERASNQEKERLLHESASRLLTAIKYFERLPGFGPDHLETGDCYSLLGRTYLEWSRINRSKLLEAKDAIFKANRIIPETNCKQALDLTILCGDIAAAENDPDEALVWYNKAITAHTANSDNITEMLARAYLSRGRLYCKTRKHESAQRDFTAAARIWRTLGELDSTAIAELEQLKLAGEFPPGYEAHMKDERPAVKIVALNLHRQNVSASYAGQARRTGTPDMSYWSRLVDEAREQIELEDSEHD